MALTPKQEAFAQAIVTGVNQSDAYRAAYLADPAAARAAAAVASQGKA